jgi:hypothetical protein
MLFSQARRQVRIFLSLHSDIWQVIGISFYIDKAMASPDFANKVIVV